MSEAEKVEVLRRIARLAMEPDGPPVRARVLKMLWLGPGLAGLLGRRSAEEAVRLYFGAVARRRWHSAFLALSPLAREGAFGSPAALRRYWTDRGRLTFAGAEPRAVLGGSMEAWRVSLGEHRFDVVCVRHGSRYTLLTGELDAELDRALIDDAAPTRAAG